MLMNTYGANCVASPSMETQAGRNILEKYPDTPGSLGIAISEAIEEAVTDPKGETRYTLGSVLNHVVLHQTVIGLEAKKQLAKVGIKKPDIVIGCCGGGSNFAGISFPFMYDKIHGDDIQIIGVEPFSCPTLTKAPFVYDHAVSYTHLCIISRIKGKVSQVNIYRQARHFAHKKVDCSTSF